MRPFCVIVYGPTGVGKSKWVNDLTEILKFPVAIINGDMGQMYLPISIGTAKPDLVATCFDKLSMSDKKLQAAHTECSVSEIEVCSGANIPLFSQDNPKIPHYLFNIIRDPLDFTVVEYREKMAQCLNMLWKENILPIIVGGSGFYLKSLFFEVADLASAQMVRQAHHERVLDEWGWDKLFEVDPERANKIHKNDKYRITRALAIWERTGKKPSDLEPEYKPICEFDMVELKRPREELNEIINQRTKVMFEAGWIDEVRRLPKNWIAFLKQKRLIGYSEIIDFLSFKDNIDVTEALVELIQQKTRAYAKRQVTFGRGLKEALEKFDKKREYMKELLEIKLEIKNDDKKELLNFSNLLTKQYHEFI